MAMNHFALAASNFTRLGRKSIAPRKIASTMAACSSESIRIAMKRLPMPASGNSSATSSGVSMLS